jgi:NAD(P)-dependent dehydrogenase (short-subunit alcohol dehydrogenase family)
MLLVERLSPVRLLVMLLHKGREFKSDNGEGVAYTASKHGLVGATKNVAWRFHKEGIRCNAVLPGGKCYSFKIEIQV